MEPEHFPATWTLVRRRKCDKPKNRTLFSILEIGLKSDRSWRPWLEPYPTCVFRTWWAQVLLPK